MDIPVQLSSSLCLSLRLENTLYPRHFSNAAHLFARADITIQDAAMIMDYISQLGEQQTCLHGLSADSALRLLRVASDASLLPLVRQTYVLHCSPSPVTDSSVPRVEEIEFRDGSAYFKLRFPAKATLADSQSTIIIVLREQVVGHIQYLTWTSPVQEEASNSEMHLLITGLEIHDDKRGRGYARLLCEHLLAQRDVACVWFMADATNFAALGLYIRLGFRILRQSWSMEGYFHR